MDRNDLETIFGIRGVNVAGPVLGGALLEEPS